MREQPGRIKREYWKLAKERSMSKSTFYFAMKRLGDRGEVVGRAGPHGPRLFLHANESFADATRVQELVAKSVDTNRKERFRRTMMHDLLTLARDKPILIDGSMLSFFDMALKNPSDSLNRTALKILETVADHYCRAIAQGDDRLDPEGELSRLWDGLGPKLVEILRKSPVEVAWALDVVAIFMDVSILPSEVVDLTIKAAFNTKLPQPTFDSVLPTFLRTLRKALREDLERHRQVRDALEKHLDSDDPEGSNRARKLWMGLGNDLRAAPANPRP